MIKKTARSDSWRHFFAFQAFNALFVGFTFSLIFGRVFPAHGPHPSFERTVVLGLIFVFGAFTYALIVRAITGSNNGMALPYVVTMPAVWQNPRNATDPIVDVLRVQGLVWIVMALFFALFATIMRGFSRKKASTLDSPMADAEIDGQTIA